MNILTNILLICAAGLTLAWLVAAQRRLVARAARRFVGMPRLQQVALVLAVGVMTVCAQKQGTGNKEQEQVTGNKEQGTSVVAEASGSDASRRAAESAEEEANVVSAENGELRMETRSSFQASVFSQTSKLRAKTALTSSSLNPCESVLSVADSQSVQSVKSVAQNISAQIEFFPNGDFITRSNNVECVYRRVNPDDWDDDGISNEEDDEPIVAADETQFGPNQTLPDGANSNAYCWVDLVVPRTNAKVTFVGDGASNLADPTFIAKAGETNRVTLLIGKTYTATCAFPFKVVAKSSEEIEETWNGENEVSLCWPVTISFVSDGDAASDAQAAAVRQMQIVDSNSGTLLATPLLASAATTEAAAASDSFSMIVIPSGLGGSFVWTNYCCSITGSAYAFELAFEGNCACSGCTAEGRFVYEGYSIVSPWGPSCRCSDPDDDDDDSPKKGVSAYFSKNVIIFEDEYEASEGVTVPRRSTRTTLVCSASGGVEGGVATFEIEGESRLARVSGLSLPITKVLGSNETFRAKIVYEGKPGSGSQPKVTAKFVSNGNSEDVLEASADLTVAQIEVLVYVKADENSSAYRHKFGICEELFLNFYPSGSGIQWFVSSGSDVDVKGRYKCPTYATTNPVKAVCGDAEFTPSIEVVEPSGIEARNPECETYGVSAGRAGWIGLKQEFYVLPLDVSFGGIQMEEVPSSVGQRTRYFAHSSFSSIGCHSETMGAGVWNGVSRENRMGDHDTACLTTELLRVDANGDFTEDTSCGWADGWITWAIPFGWTSNLSARYHADAEPEKMFDPGANQRFTITPTGSVTVEKFGNVARRDIDGKVFCNGTERQVDK